MLLKPRPYPHPHQPRRSLRPVSQVKGTTAPTARSVGSEPRGRGDEKGAVCCREVSCFISTLISSGQPQGKEEEQNSFSSTDELGRLDSPEGCLSVWCLLNYFPLRGALSSVCMCVYGSLGASNRSQSTGRCGSWFLSRWTQSLEWDQRSLGLFFKALMSSQIHPSRLPCTHIHTE